MHYPADSPASRTQRRVNGINVSAVKNLQATTENRRNPPLSCLTGRLNDTKRHRCPSTLFSLAVVPLRAHVRGLMSFAELPALLAEALASRGYAAPTAVQAAVIAPEAAGRDLVVSAQTGSGKTVAFGLPMHPQPPRQER